MQLSELMEQNFIEYASYVIKDRAIPEIRDGLKPVQRRILHSLFEKDDGRFNKVANVVGHCMQYHPHGDASIYAALVNLANKEYFIEKQGNFGNIHTGDAASAARYIECRLTPLAREVLFNKDITQYVDSYDGRNKEPVCLPSKVPVTLMLGTEGIAVGLATKILPHNFVELLEAQIKVLKGESATVYPDFLQGGFADVCEYNDGNGKVKLRAVIDIQNSKSLVIREVPYGVTTESLISSIDSAAKKGKIRISQINDYTTDKVEIEVVPARGISAEETKLALYAFTDCEVSTSINLIAIKDGKPVQFTVTEILKQSTEQLIDLLRVELQIELNKLLEALHEKVLIHIFVTEEIYKLIVPQTSYEAVQHAVLEALLKSKSQKYLQRSITVQDVDKLLQLPIKKLSKFDATKNVDSLQEIKNKVREIKNDLEHLTDYAIKYLEALIVKYSATYPRRTQITSFDSVDVKTVALANLKVQYDLTKGYIGTELSGTHSTLMLTAYDKVLCMSKNGTLVCVPANQKKKFVGEHLVYAGKWDKQVVFSLVYKNVDNLSYYKRFRVEKLITEKEYRFLPEGGEVQALTCEDSSKVQVEFAAQKYAKTSVKELELKSRRIRKISSIGVKLCWTNKIVEKVVFM